MRVFLQLERKNTGLIQKTKIADQFLYEGFTMTVSKVLQSQAGIQYQGVLDKSEAEPRDSLNNVLLVGQFKRGRTDKPFKVTNTTIRALLGYEPSNPDYVAVEDALADGAPYVWVQRYQVAVSEPPVEGPSEPPVEEPSEPPLDTSWDIKYLVNGQWITELTGPIVTQNADRSNAYKSMATELMINDTVTEIGDYAFNGWAALTKVSLGNTLKTIGMLAMKGLSNVLELVIPNSVETIKYEAFRGLTKAKRITVGTGVTFIGDYALAEAFILDALIMLGATPPANLGSNWFVMDSGSYGYTTGVMFVPDESFYVYKGTWRIDRVRRMSGLETYDFTKPYHYYDSEA